MGHHNMELLYRHCSLEMDKIWFPKTNFGPKTKEISYNNTVFYTTQNIHTAYTQS